MSDHFDIYAIVIGSGALTCVLTFIYIIIYEWRKRINVHIGVDSSATQNELQTEDDILQEYRKIYTDMEDEIKIDENDLIYDNENGQATKKTIGTGKFGVVYLATLTVPGRVPVKVACKCIKLGPGVREFFEEGLRMRKFQHENVINLIGISYPKDRHPILVTEYMANGNLHEYINDPKNDRTVGLLLTFAIQIAHGMAHLHEKMVIHRDLAARNCLLDENLKVKVGDFGLARECGANMTYIKTKSRLLPLAWLPIEAFENIQFTDKGDLWAYGVVLWELMSYGEDPYRTISKEWKDGYSDVGLLKYLIKKRLPMPDLCPPKLYTDVMTPCWATEMHLRPSFTRIIEMVEDIAEHHENTPTLPNV